MSFLDKRLGLVRRLSDTDFDSFVDALARRIAKASAEQIEAFKIAVDATQRDPLVALTTANEQPSRVFGATAAGLTHRALAAGAQARAGERRLEAILDSL